MGYIVFDIETLALPVPEDAIEEKRKELQEEYAKPETVEKHLASWKERFKFKPDGCKPIAIATAYVTRNGHIEHVTGLASEDSGAVAKHFYGAILENPQAKLVGYNILGFDLPILTRTLFDSMPPGFGFAGEQSLPKIDRRKIDLMWEPFGRGFDTTGGFKRLCRMFGVKLCGIDGSMVASMWTDDQKNKTTTVLDYCKDDVRGCAELFSKLLQLYEF